ncbi:conserved hypothetical protein [Verticillium alfalfae VaMs.102]|uniref:Zn(2)-C6 fungal-type domain-containing protein n=1 Tax=Verticillium alfalfae (strain VaMs.102 / ATCC MYA-4576 / FGSC 10136) TaxID=526221 RepID=C9S6G7_VERA1|nr:conserved hypothetical protein [Verticillium alfalfae VaMs.102]EEY15154.1 conserved hypothetical protein [Verticillium alfalfae VaMs.102]
MGCHIEGGCLSTRSDAKSPLPIKGDESERCLLPIPQQLRASPSASSSPWTARGATPRQRRRGECESAHVVRSRLTRFQLRIDKGAPSLDLCLTTPAPTYENECPQGSVWVPYMKRRVKCDEAKPFCQRCVKWQGFCDGYDLFARAAAAADAARSLAPAAQRLRRLAPAPAHLDSRILLEPTECRRHRQVPSQGVRADNAPRNGSPRPAYGQALSYYGRALSDVRRATADPSSLRATVVCCLLFVCFEVLHTDCRAAYAHLDNGQLLMHEMTMRARSSGIKSNIVESEALERDFLQIFQRLIHQTWSYGVIRPPLMAQIEAQAAPRKPQTMWCCRGGPKNHHVIENMPDSFDDFSEARRWWEVTQHAATHTSHVVFRVSHNGLGSLFSGNSESIKMAMEEATYGHMATEDDLFGNRHARSRHHVDSVERWWLAFRPLWEAVQAVKDQDKARYLQGAHLRVQYLNLYASVMSPLGCDFPSVVAMTPIYSEIVSLSSEILPRQRDMFGAVTQGDIFSMDAAVTFPLFQASMRCRDANVREAAIRLLQENPRRDGMWDSRMFEALVVQNRTLEVENAREGSLEEQWSRLQQRRAHLDEEGTLKTIGLLKDVAAGKWRLQQEAVGRFLYD